MKLPVAALETRSTLPDGTRVWHVVQTWSAIRATETVRALLGPRASVELTGTTFQHVPEDAPRVLQVHRREP